MICFKEEGNNLIKWSEVVLKEFFWVEKCVEDNLNKEVLENVKEDLEVNEDGFVVMFLWEWFVENENVISEE